MYKSFDPPTAKAHAPQPRPASDTRNAETSPPVPDRFGWLRSRRIRYGGLALVLVTAAAYAGVRSFGGGEAQASEPSFP